MVAVWEAGEREPWLVLTDLAPADVGVAWYGLRVWVALGFRVLKSFGWHWERIRREQADRVARHWLVLAVATLVTVAYGTRLEDAAMHGVAPPNLRAPRPWPPDPAPRIVSLVARGLAWLGVHVLRGGGLWRRLWLLPQPWPTPADDLIITYHPAPSLAAAV